MKYLFLLAGIITFSFVSAQNDEVYYLQKQIKKKTGLKITSLPNYQFSIPIQPKKDLVYTLPDGNKVSALPQDNMPCIIPDMSQFNMPCIKPEKQTNNMPVLKGTVQNNSENRFLGGEM
jgi:hypothetical protein